jgi:diguanylate cyclase (GGDEF)-like protein
MREIYYDELTRSYNRRYLHYWIDNEIKRATRFSAKFAVLMLDIDNFRNINNNFGHLEGDKVLIDFSRVLRVNIREVDSLVRYGGDEYIILMPNTDENGALDLAQRIMDYLNESDISGHKIHCSMGYAVFPEDGNTSEHLINQADNLMYSAKKQGKNRIGSKHQVLEYLQIPSLETIGREDETEWCLGELKGYDTLFVVGEAGIGKTRLVLEIKERMETPIFLRGNAYAALTEVPYHPFRNMFGEMIKRDFDLVQRVFKQLPAISQAEIMKIFPADSSLKIPYAHSLDKYRLFNAVSEFFQKLSGFYEPKKVVLLLDDLHWLDEASCELMDFIIRSTNGRYKIFGTYRIEEINNSTIEKFFGVWTREKLYTQITISPLNEKQTERLLKAIMGKTPGPGFKRIFRQSGGNPFYLEEIIRELERQGKLYWNGKEWVFARKLEITIPGSIEATIKRKLKFLNDEVKKYLEIAAVYGQEFSAEIIALASKRNVGQILDAIDDLTRIGFLKERVHENYFFSEDLVRQIVYKNIKHQDLTKYHKVVGQTLEAIYRNVLSNHYEQLATHFMMANEVSKALYYSKEAAHKAQEEYAHSSAIKHYENALKYEDNIEEIFKIKYALADTFSLVGNSDKAIAQANDCLKINPNSYRVYEKLGNVYEDIGEYQKSLKQYKMGLKLTKGTDAVYNFKSSIAWLFTRLGNYKRAESECNRILEKKTHLSKQTLGDTYLILGVIYLRSGGFKKAERYIKRALKIRETGGDKKRIAACYIDLGLNYYEKLEEDKSHEFYERALKIYEEIGHQQGILIAYNNIGALYANSDLTKAEEYYLKALKQAKLVQAKQSIVYLYSNLGAIEFNRMMYDQTLLHYKTALKLATKMNYHEGIVFSNIGLSDFYRTQNKPKRGRVHLERAVKAAKRVDMKYLHFDCVKEEIDFLILERKIKKADVLSKKMLSELRQERKSSYKGNGLIYRGKTYAEQKKYKKALEYYEKALLFLETYPNTRLIGETLFLKGMVYKKQNKTREALKMFLKAIDIFREKGNLRFVDKIEQVIAETDK